MLRHRLGAKLLGGTMVFWILYRAKEDGAVMLVSLAPNSSSFLLLLLLLKRKREEERVLLLFDQEMAGNFMCSKT